MPRNNPSSSHSCSTSFSSEEDDDDDLIVFEPFPKGRSGGGPTTEATKAPRQSSSRRRRRRRSRMVGGGDATANDCGYGGGAPSMEPPTAEQAKEREPRRRRTRVRIQLSDDDDDDGSSRIEEEERRPPAVPPVKRRDYSTSGTVDVDDDGSDSSSSSEEEVPRRPASRARRRSDRRYRQEKTNRTSSSVFKEGDNLYSSSPSSEEEEQHQQRRGDNPAEKEKVAGNADEQEEEEDDGEDEDEDEMHLEEPYTQNLGRINFSNGNSIDDSSGSSSSDDDFGDGGGTNDIHRKLRDRSNKEPLRPGDVVHYYSHLYVSGDKRGFRAATVLSVDPDRCPILVLDNGEHLPGDTQVKRVKTWIKNDKALSSPSSLSGSGGKRARDTRRGREEGTLVDHPGIFRPICRFKLVKMARPGVEGINNGVAQGLHGEANRVGRILSTNMERLKGKAQKDGFAPLDMFNDFSRGGGSGGSESTTAAAAADKKTSRSSLRSATVPASRSKALRASLKRTASKAQAAPSCSSSPTIEDPMSLREEDDIRLLAALVSTTAARHRDVNWSSLRTYGGEERWNELVDEGCSPLDGDDDDDAFDRPLWELANQLLERLKKGRRQRRGQMEDEDSISTSTTSATVRGGKSMTKIGEGRWKPSKPSMSSQETSLSSGSAMKRSSKPLMSSQEMSSSQSSARVSPPHTLPVNDRRSTTVDGTKKRDKKRNKRSGSFSSSSSSSSLDELINTKIFGPEGNRTGRDGAGAGATAAVATEQIRNKMEHQKGSRPMGAAASSTVISSSHSSSSSSSSSSSDDCQESTLRDDSTATRRRRGDLLYHDGRTASYAKASSPPVEESPRHSPPPTGRHSATPSSTAASYGSHDGLGTKRRHRRPPLSSAPEKGGSAKHRAYSFSASDEDDGGIDGIHSHKRKQPHKAGEEDPDEVVVVEMPSSRKGKRRKEEGWKSQRSQLVSSHSSALPKFRSPASDSSDMDNFDTSTMRRSKRGNSSAASPQPSSGVKQRVQKRCRKTRQCPSPGYPRSQMSPSSCDRSVRTKCSPAEAPSGFFFQSDSSDDGAFEQRLTSRKIIVGVKEDSSCRKKQKAKKRKSPSVGGDNSSRKSGAMKDVKNTSNTSGSWMGRTEKAKQILQKTPLVFTRVPRR